LLLEVYQVYVSIGGGAPQALYAAIGGMTIAALLLLMSVLACRSQAHRSDEQQFEALVAATADYAIYLLDRGGRVTTWNAGAERLKGYATSEIVGEHYSRFFTAEDQQNGVPQKALEVAASRRGKLEIEGWRVRRDGTRFYVNASLSALRDPSGNVTGFAKITRDVTEQIQQAEALEQTRAALQQAQKMEALGQLTGGMAHDFNNILHVIKNALEILQLRLKPNAEATRYLDMAQRSADRAAGVTQRLLAFARRQPLDPKPINANRLLQGMSDMLRHAVGDGVSVETVFSSGLWTVSADSNQLETSVLNLTINARDAMSRVGKLTIETANAFLDEPYAAIHPEVTAGQYVMIAISDTGSGMSQETLAKAFDPFFTTKQTEGGTGLGLSQVFGFVKQSGGHVKMYSEPSNGTTVKIYLPRLQAAGAYLVSETVNPGEGGRGETVMVVEDHEDVRAFAVEMLTSLGYRVIAAADALSALEALQRLAHLDLLFTDVGLPNGMNGKELADEVRKLQPHASAAVLFTTGYARNAIVHHGRLDPGVDLLLKPYTQLDLARKVRSVLAKRSVDNV